VDKLQALQIGEPITNLKHTIDIRCHSACMIQLTHWCAERTTS